MQVIPSSWQASSCKTREDKVFDYLESQGFKKDFITSLTSKQYLVSGSVILKVLTMANWDAGDLDVFLMLPSCLDDHQITEKVKADFDVSDSEIVKKSKTYLGQFSPLSDKEEPERIMNFYLKSVRKPWQMKLNVVIGVGTCVSTEHFIINTFDLDICANWISNNGLYTMIEDLSPTTTEANLHPYILDVLEKEVKNNWKEILEEDSSISIPFSLEVLPRLKWAEKLNKNCYRIEKYLKRGFRFDQLVGTSVRKI